MWRQCGGNVAAMWRRCGGDVVAMWRPHDDDIFDDFDNEGTMTWRWKYPYNLKSLPGPIISCHRNQQSNTATRTLWTIAFASKTQPLLTECHLPPKTQNRADAQAIKGPDNPTSQLLPIMSAKGCSRDGEGRKGKGGGEGIERLKQLCVTKWNVKDGVWRRKMGVCVWQSSVRKMVCVKVVCERGRCDKVVCERWCVTKWCVKDGVWQSCVWRMVWWKMVCDKVVCEGWCGERWCGWKFCVKERVWQSCVWKTVCDKVVCERWCVKDGVWQSCVWKMVWWKMVCGRWCGERWCGDKVVCDKVVCETWCVKDGVWQSWV